MKKRLLCFIMTLVLCIAILPAASASGTVITIEPPDALPKAGETFDVKVALSGNPGLCAVQFTLTFDKGAMTCTNVSTGKVLSGTLSVTNANGASGAIVAAATATPVTDDGNVATFKFKAEKDITSWDFGIKSATLAGEKGDDIAFSVSGGKTENPVKPGDPTKPDDPVDPADDPVKPDDPVNPADDSHEQEDPVPPWVDVIRFTDTNGHWGAEYISLAARMGLFKGYPDGSFHPDDAINRADFITVLWRASGSPEPTGECPFEDVDKEAYFAKAITWAKEKGYVDGTSETTFSPAGTLTRQAAMKILFAFSGGVSGMEMMFYSVYDAQFADSDQIADWGKAGMYWGFYNEIINGVGNDMLSPRGAATRAQLAKILVIYTEKFGTN